MWEHKGTVVCLKYILKFILEKFVRNYTYYNSIFKRNYLFKYFARRINFFFNS